MNTKINSPCVLVRTIKILDYLTQDEDNEKVLVEDVINGDIFNASLSDIKHYTYQGEDLLLIAGDLA